MLKSYQLVLIIALVFGCFNLETESFSRHFKAIHHHQNATYGKPAVNYQPGFNSTRPNQGIFNNTRLVPLQKSTQYGALNYQAPPQQPNIGFHNNLAVSQPLYAGFLNSTAHGNHTYPQGIRPNSTYPYAKLFKLW